MRRTHRNLNIHARANCVDEECEVVHELDEEGRRAALMEKMDAVDNEYWNAVDKLNADRSQKMLDLGVVVGE